MMHFPDSLPIPLIHLEATDSTNEHLKQCCERSPIAEFTTVVAEFQCSGRGQRGTSWESEAGKNLLFSFVLYPTFLEARRQFLLSQLISVVLQEELASYSEGFSIKWPNDIYYQERKIAGILIEHELTGANLSRTIIGVGLNVNQTTFYSTAPNPVSLQQITRKEEVRENLLTRVMERVKAEYAAIRESEPPTLNARYQAALFRGRGMHLFTDANGPFRAAISRVEPKGLLLLRKENGAERSYAFKEVQYLL